MQGPNHEFGVVHEAYDRSVEILEGCATDFGFSASDDGDVHYGGLWVRDAGITASAALTLNDEKLLRSVRGMLDTISENLNDQGQVPNTVWPSRKYRDYGEIGSADVPSWFIKTASGYVRATGDTAYGAKILPYCEQAYSWLRHQDTAGFSMVTSPGAADWMDSTFQRRGLVLHNNALYYEATLALESLGRSTGKSVNIPDTELVRDHINQQFWPTADKPLGNLLKRSANNPTPDWPHPASLAAFEEAIRHDREFFVSHVSYANYAETCDVLGNLLAIRSGIADETQAGKILDYIQGSGATKPFMIRTYPEPATPDNDPYRMYDLIADKHQDPRWRNTPNTYHNAGCWPFIGGYFVTALAEAGRQTDAKQALIELAESNRFDNWGFLEWVDSKDPDNPRRGARRQAWNAATNILAYQACEKAGILAE